MASTSTPNIILINCDDLGYGDLGCYGSTANRTPCIDRLADEGVRFTDFYMAAPVCSPSRGAMMTGCYPRRISFDRFEPHWVLWPGSAVGLNPDEVTVADLLKEQGYATKLVGKWHCGDQPDFLPTRHGFDSYYGLPYSNDMAMSERKPSPGKPTPPLPLLQDEQVVQEQPDQAAITERYVEQSARFIRENRDRPFFLYFAHMYVHVPLIVPETFHRRSQNGRYGAAVECIDWATHALLHEIERLGLDEQTLIVFTSDNGPRGLSTGGSAEPLRGGKGTTWEGGMRVPCIMRWPGQIPAGRVTSELSSAMDLLPTFASLAGAQPPNDRIIDGRDIWHLATGEHEARSPHEVFFYYQSENLEAVRDHRWKLHVHKRDEAIFELYDLHNDVGETTNVVDEHPDIVAELQARLETCRADIGDGLTDQPGANRRPVGRVDNPQTLTEYDPDHPYIVAMYDRTDIA